MTWPDKIESSVACRAHAEHLRKLAKTVTTLGLRKTLMDAAADYDKLARQSGRLINIGNATFPPA
jgi:hypothetical protein